MKKVIFGTLFLGLIGLSIIGCKKEINQNKDDPLNHLKENEQKSLQKNVASSPLTLKMLKSTNVSILDFDSKNSGKVELKGQEKGDFKVSENIIILEIFNENYIVSINDGNIIVNNLTKGVFKEYNEINDIAKNIDKVITLALSIAIYTNEMGGKNYTDKTPPTPLDWTHWCINPRKSYCSREHVMGVISDFCGGAPSWVGYTDFGCIWGDFGCVGVTDFHC